MRALIRHFTLVVIMLVTIRVYPQWEVIRPYPGGDGLLGIFMVNPDSGWITGTEGCILFTGDGGNSWDFQGSGSSQDLHAAFFLNGREGWITGCKGAILHTADAGTSWESQTCPVEDDLYCVWFIGDTGWIAGGSGTILKTENGGLTWQSLNSGSEDNLRSVHFTDPQTGWVTGDGGTVLHTADGGATWSRQGTFSAYEEFCGVYFFSPLTGRATGSHAVYSTDDGGETWVVVYQSPLSLAGSCYLDQEEAWVIGWSDLDFQYYACHTADNFQHCEIRLGSDKSMNAIGFTDVSHGWVAGDDLLVRSTGDAGQTWVPQAEFLISPFNDVWAIGQDRGWVAGDHGTICLTPDGGESWQFPESGTDADLLAVCFTDQDYGWMTGEQGTILHSTDAGYTWKIQASGGTETLMDVYFADRLKGWIVGQDGLILHTGDGGETWQQQPGGTSEELRSIWFTDTQTGWVAGGGTGVILHTTDGGNSWEQQYQDGYPLRDICFTDAMNGWAFGSNMLATGNGGGHWSKLPTFCCSYDVFTDVWFTDPMNGWIIALYNYLGNEYYDFFHTGDGGMTWEQQYLYDRTGSTKKSLFFTDHSHGWAAGDGIVYKTANGGGAFGIPETGDGIFGMTLYPNPAPDRLMVHFRLVVPAPVLVTISDHSGKIMEERMMECNWEGEQSLGIDVRHYAPGVYLLSLQADGARLTAKFTVLR